MKARQPLPHHGTFRQRGFTLIEAIVALVVFSMAAMGIYSWINSNLITLNRVAQVAANEQVINSAIERIKLIDLSQETEGTFQANEYFIHWQAELVEPWKKGMTAAGAIGLYDLGLFAIHLHISRDGRELGSYVYRRVAYKQVREFKLDDRV